ncbi:Pyridine nucleotide-disulfide oxidoreductase [Luteimonas sp. 9C]|uniref:FAD/NAD(P)-binding protein n=1 Tax=Luteimonas sp. 9C TaxID=2653148 RepID=UPI0012F19799|nr:FAD-dependent oxidoreductase [Luteimonas sp. 9C]VXA91654.1 Pyridine nucleotide-disulfide oxidoreductase [Luteimonas sp. 9C]
MTADLTAAGARAAFDVLVVGGGASGALVALHLLDREGLRVALAEPRPAPARGTAYSTPRAEHVLNVNAARMSAFDAVPDDFVAWLRTQPECIGREDAAVAAQFAPRRVYGRYLQARLDAHPARASLAVHAEAVVDIERDGAGFIATCASGAQLHARAVVLATGSPSATLPGGVPVAGAVDAWDYDAVAEIASEADVGIVGAGLSMVDVLLTLQANGHRGRVHAISRNGLMPLAHAPGTVPQPGGVEALMLLGVRARMRMVRQWAADAVAQGRPWQDAVERLRPHARALWQAWPATERRRFLRHAVRQWDIHRHRIAPGVAAIVDDMAATGRFSLQAGRLLRIEARDGRVAIDWTPRGAAPATTGVDVVVNATGMEKRLSRAPGRLLPALHARGLVAPGPLDLGLATRGDGEVLDANGEVVPGLWTLGATRIGDLWETIAMPELRGQAERVAIGVQQTLAGR